MPCLGKTPFPTDQEELTPVGETNQVSRVLIILTDVNIFKELETHEEEHICKFDKSPSPASRPEYPANKGTFLSNAQNGMKKPRTLASVLEKQNKEVKSSKLTYRNVNNSNKESKLIKPTNVENVKSMHEKEPTEHKSASKIGSRTFGFNSSIKAKPTSAKGVVGDTGSADTGMKSIKDRITGGIGASKAVKHAKFDLTDSK